MIPYSFASVSDRGPRKVNEDRVSVWSLHGNALAVAIADGLGALGGGDQAAELAIRAIQAAASDNALPSQKIRQIFQEIHRDILDQQSRSPETSRMATTLTVGFFTDWSMWGAHCGDCRVQMARSDGIIRLTRDHTEAQRYFDEGLISREELDTYPRKNVLSTALGGPKDPYIEDFCHDVRIGDKFIFSSDGLHNKLYIREMKALLYSTSEASEAVKIITKAVSDRKPDDNFSVAVIFRDKDRIDPYG